MKKQLLWQNSFIFLPPYVLGNIYLPSVGSFDQCVHSFFVLTKLLPLPPLLWHRNYLFALYNYISFVETERKETCDCDGNLSSFRRISSVFQNEALLYRVVTSLWVKFEIRLNHIYKKKLGKGDDIARNEAGLTKLPEHYGRWHGLLHKSQHICLRKVLVYWYSIDFMLTLWTLNDRQIIPHQGLLLFSSLKAT